MCIRDRYTYTQDVTSRITSIDAKFSSQIDDFKSMYYGNVDTYNCISQSTNVPPELIAAMHFRESNNDFSKYMQNGDPLGAPTVQVPKGIYFDNFTDSAIAAFTSDDYRNRQKEAFGLSADSKDIVAMCAFAELYNGLGYQNNGRISAYVYSGTNVYTGGLYVGDGVFNDTKSDPRPGVYALIDSIMP